MKKFPIAILSTAHIHSKSLLESLNSNPDCGATLLWDDDGQRGQKYAVECRAKFFSDLDEMLSQPEISGFLIGSENCHHTKLLEKIIPFGKPILCQKPLVTSVTELEKISRLLKKHSTRLSCTYQLPFSGAMQTVKKFIAEGTFGKITRVRYRYAHHAAYGLWFDNPELGWFHDPELAVGGAFMDLGTNAVHLLRSLFGPAKKVWACIRNEADVYPRVDDFGIAMIEFQNNVLATVEAAWTQIGGINGLEIMGSEKSLWHNGSHYIMGKPTNEVATLPEMPHQPSQVDRLIAILNNQIPEEELVADQEAVFDTVRIIEAAYEASEKKKWVKVS